MSAEVRKAEGERVYAWRKKNPLSKIKKSTNDKKWWARLSMEKKKRHNERTKAWGKAHPIEYALIRLRKEAKWKRRPFNLTAKDISFPEKCPVLGIEMNYNDPASEGYRQFDEIVPKKGYVSGNVKVISKRANRIKNDGTAEEHLKIADYIRSEGNETVA